MLTIIINFSNLHLKNQKKLIIYLFYISLTNCTMYACNSFSIWKSIQFCNYYVRAQFLKVAFEKL